MMDTTTRREADAAIRWLESQDMYRFNDFTAPSEGLRLSKYFFNFREERDACARDARDEYCPACDYSFPAYITGLPWTEEDDWHWMNYLEDAGNWAKVCDYLGV